MHIKDLKVGDKVRAIKDMPSSIHARFSVYKNDVLNVGYIGYGYFGNYIVKLIAPNTDIFATEDLFNKYFEKVEQPEKVKVPVTSNDKPKMTRFEKDILDDNAKHDNIKSETNDENKVVDEQHNEVLEVTEDDIAMLIEQSEIVTDRIYSDYMVVTCRLPNGYALSETFDLDGMDEDAGIEWCVNKIADRVLELETYRLKANAYDDYGDDWPDNDDDDNDDDACEGCGARFDCVDSPYYNNY